jgi:hypothetical protein
MEKVKKFQKPVSRILNDDKSVTLYFEFDDEEMRYPQAEFDIRGGICFPTEFKDEHGNFDIQGFAVLVAMDIEKKIFWVFEERSFIVIDNILNNDQMIECHGIASWFNSCWSQYYCRKYYWHQDNELVKQYRLEIGRSEMIQPKPILIEIPWGNDSDARHFVWKSVKSKKLRCQKGTELYRQLEYAKKGDKQTYPAVHALQCALMGMERFPFRKRVSDLHSPVSFDVGLFR